MNRNNIVSGLTIEDILSKDINKLSMSELRAMNTRLVSAANKRIKRIESQNETSPALRAVKKSKKNFSSKGLKTLNEHRKLQAELRTFLQAETSTLTGIKKVKKATAQSLKEQGVKNVNENAINEMWEIFNKIAEIDSSVDTPVMKYAVVDSIMDEMTAGKTSDDIINSLYDRMDEIYEQHVESLTEPENSSKISYDELYNELYKN